MRSVVGSHLQISGMLFMSAMFNSVAIKQDKAEEFGAKKWSFSWPLTGLSQIIVDVVFKGYQPTLYLF